MNKTEAVTYLQCVDNNYLKKLTQHLKITYPHKMDENSKKLLISKLTSPKYLSKLSFELEKSLNSNELPNSFNKKFNELKNKQENLKTKVKNVYVSEESYHNDEFLRNEIKKIQNQLTKRDEKINELRKELDKVTKNCKKSQDKDKQIECLKNKNRSYFSENKNLKKQIDNLKKQIDNLKKQIDNLKNKNLDDLKDKKLNDLKNNKLLIGFPLNENINDELEKFENTDIIVSDKIYDLYDYNKKMFIKYSSLKEIEPVLSKKFEDYDVIFIYKDLISDSDLLFIHQKNNKIEYL